MTAALVSRRSCGLLLALLIPAVGSARSGDTVPSVEIVPAAGPAVANLLWLTDDIPGAKAQLEPWSHAGFYTHIVSTPQPIRRGGEVLEEVAASVSALVEARLPVGPLYVVAEGPYGAVAVLLTGVSDRLVGIALEDLEDIEGHVGSTALDSNFDPHWLLPVGSSTPRSPTDRLAVHIFPLSTVYPEPMSVMLEPHRVVSVAAAPMMEVSLQAGPRLDLSLPHSVWPDDGPALTETTTATSIQPPHITRVCATAGAPSDCTT